ncbi:MAG: DUF305 domain-containing protein [Geminicoccaceae bacterium]
MPDRLANFDELAGCPSERRVLPRSFGGICPIALLVVAPLSALADQPPRPDRSVRVELLKLSIDHHCTAMRMTELLAGTDPKRDAAIPPTEGTAPTHGFGATQVDASLNDLRPLMRRDNRMQREEIVTLQTCLREWYGIAYEPQLWPDGAELIRRLAQSGRGDAFEHVFLETFHRYHRTLLRPLDGCLTGSDPAHHDLRRLCSQMWHGQTADIEEMRQELERHFAIADFWSLPDAQPLGSMDGPPRSQHDGGQPQSEPGRRGPHWSPSRVRHAY